VAIGGKQFVLDYDNGFPCLRIDITICSPDPKNKEKHLFKNVLIDTGSDVTIIPNHVIKELALIYTGFRNVENFNGEEVRVNFYAAKIIIIGIVEEIIEVGGIDSEPLIGMDLICNFHLLLNAPFGTFEIANRSNYILPLP